MRSRVSSRFSFPGINMPQISGHVADSGNHLLGVSSNRSDLHPPVQFTGPRPNGIRDSRRNQSPLNLSAGTWTRARVSLTGVGQPRKRKCTLYLHVSQSYRLITGMMAYRAASPRWSCQPNHILSQSEPLRRTVCMQPRRRALSGLRSMRGVYLLTHGGEY